MANLQVQNLDFDGIKSNLKQYLKSQTTFQDYDFEGSSLSILLDLLAYTTHYSGFHAHMLNNESNIDSANLKASMTSKAKLLNYVPGSKKSAEATVKFKVNVNAGNQPVDRKILIPRGYSIKSNNSSSDSRSFILVDDVHIYDKSVVRGIYQYESDDILVYEGSFESQRFVVDSSLLNQRFIIRDPDIDISTLRVRVFDSEADDNFIPYKLAEDYMTINSDSPVFFLTVNEDDYYEIQFGNGVYGRKVENLNMVECTFVSSSGEQGNNAKSFTFGGEYAYEGKNYVIDVTALSPAEGGMDSETVDDLRFNIPYHHRRQNRAVIVDDYKNLLLSEYRNINSVNVWGGEDNVPKEYGKVFICIKPKFGEVLSSKAKENIINNIIKRHNVTVIEAEIVDPDFLYVNMDVNVQYNPVNTILSPGEIVTACNTAIETYNTDVLNRFGSFYSDVELNTRVRSSDTSILSSFTSLKLEKQFSPTLDIKQTYLIDYANAIAPNSVKSNEFMFRLSRCYFTDDGNGNIKMYYFNTGKGVYEQYVGETFGEVDYMTGIVRLTDFEVNSVIGSNELSVHTTPIDPDFHTKRNNIVVINHFKVNAVEHFENENEK